MVCLEQNDSNICKKKCLVIIFSSLSSVHPPPLSRVWMLGACLGLEDVTLFLWILLSQEEFSQQPAVTWLAWTIEWSPLCCRSGIFTGSLPLSGPRTGPPGHCSPELGREFLLHSILNSLASGDRGARTSVVCTQPQICHSGPVYRLTG